MYDVALVCENGHEVNPTSQEFPEFNAKHCKKCGARAINTCPSCETLIRGLFLSGGFTGAYRVPAHCHECGSPYPWTKTKLEVAEERIRLNEELSDEQKKELVGAIHDVATDTPKTKVAVEKIKLHSKKVGRAAYKFILDVVTDVASETAKKMLGLK